MKFFSHFSLVVFLVLALSCDSSSKETEAFDFPVVFDLQGKVVFEDELSVLIDLAGDYLIFEQDRRAKGNELYHVYDADSHDFLGAVGKTGNVPGGFIGAQYCGQYYLNDDGNTVFWVNDAPKRKISAINLEQSLNSDFVVLDDHVVHEPQHDFMNALYVLDNNSLAGHQPGFIKGSNKHPFYYLDENDETSDLRAVGEYPIVKNIESFSEGDKHTRSLKRLSTVMKPDKTRFAYAFRWYDRLDIFNLDGEIISSIRHPQNYREYNASNILDLGLRDPLINITKYYQMLRSTDELIFALYRNRKKGSESEGDLISEIRVFDWSGNLEYLLKCPNDLLTFEIDARTGRLYGYDIATESFLQYDISMLFE